MKASDKDKILNEILAPNDLTRLRERTLNQGLSALRVEGQARRNRRLLLVTVMPALALLVIWASQIRFTLGPARLHSRSSVAVPQTQRSTVKVISDEELFALFPNRPMALVGKPGHQELVFLDQGDPPDSTTR